MVNIIESKISFKNPQVGQPTKAIEEHYNGRRIIADVNGQRQAFRFKKDEMPFSVTEDEMIAEIEKRL